VWILALFRFPAREHATGADDSRRVLLPQYQIPLTVVSYKELYGWTMDEIVREIGTKNNCTFCGVFRRQVLPPRCPRVYPGKSHHEASSQAPDSSCFRGLFEDMKT